MASFDVSEAPDDPETVHVYATVDVDEPEQVLDLVIERVLALQEEGIPIHVIPLRTPEREAAMLEAERRAAAGPTSCSARSPSRVAVEGQTQTA